MNDINTERAGPSASLTWYGQAGFRLAAANSRVLIDPFLTGRNRPACTATQAGPKRFL